MHLARPCGRMMSLRGGLCRAWRVICLAQVQATASVMREGCSKQCWSGSPSQACGSRSLGLSLLECMTGRYPYDASGGPLQLMIQARQRSRSLTQTLLFHARAAYALRR